MYHLLTDKNRFYFKLCTCEKFKPGSVESVSFLHLTRQNVDLNLRLICKIKMSLPHKEPSLSRDYLEGEGLFFRNQSNAIKENINQELYKNFCNITNDEERVKFIYNLEVVHKIDLPSSPFEKSSEKASNLKNQGNTSFGKENYVQAIKMYGFALMECPKNEETLLSTIYANRSAAFYHLKEYKLSLEDIQLSLSSAYPENLQHKVLEQKSKLDSNNRQKKEHDFSLMIAMLTKTLSEKIPPKNQIGTKRELPPVPTVSGTPNQNIPTASNLVRIEHNPNEGRFAVAEKDIEPGDVLVVEKAHCANLLFDFSKTHCQHCFVRVIYFLPCPNCANVVFCSVKCRNQALNTYHKYECSFLGSLWTSGSSIVCSLAVRLITQRGLKYFLDAKAKLTENLPETGKYDPNDYRTVYNLCRHETNRTHLDFFQRSVMSVVLLRFLQNAGFFSKTESNLNNNNNSDISKLSNKEANLKNGKQTKLTVDETFIGGLLLHNLQVLQFNAHEIAELQFNADFPGDIERAKSQFIGGGLFPTLALFNHSCEPGIVRYFSGSKVIVRAVKPIQSGDLIAENYGPIYTQVPREERRVELKTRYWFDCNCKPCVQDWPEFGKMQTDILPFRCIKNRSCPGVALVRLNTDEFMFPCPECKEMICIFSSLKGLSETEAMFKKGENFLKNHLYQDALKVFIKIMKLLDNTLKPPYKDFCLCQQKIRSAMLTFGNVHHPSTIINITPK